VSINGVPIGASLAYAPDLPPPAGVWSPKPATVSSRDVSIAPSNSQLVSSKMGSLRPLKIANNAVLDTVGGLAKAGWQETLAIFYPFEVLADYCALAARNPGGAFGLLAGGFAGAFHTIWDMVYGTAEFLAKEPDLSKMLQEAIKLCAYLREHSSELPAQLESALAREVKEIQALYNKGDPASMFKAGHRISHMVTTVFVAIEGAIGSGKTLGNLGKSVFGKAVSVTNESVIVSTLKNLKPEQASRGVEMANYLAQHPEKAVRMPKEVMSALKMGLEKNADQPGVQQALRRLREIEAPGGTRVGARSSQPQSQLQSQSRPTPQAQPVPPSKITSVPARPVASNPANLREIFKSQIKETGQANAGGQNVSLVYPVKDIAAPGGVRLERIDNISPSAARTLLHQLTQQKRLALPAELVFNYNGIGGRTPQGRTVSAEQDLRQREGNIFFGKLTPEQLRAQAEKNTLIVNGKRGVPLPLEQWRDATVKYVQANKHGNTVSLAIQRLHTFKGPYGQTRTMPIVEAWAELTPEEVRVLLNTASGYDRAGRPSITPTLINPSGASHGDARVATLKANGLSPEGLQQRHNAAKAETRGADKQTEAKANTQSAAIDAALKTEWDARAQWVQSLQTQIDQLPGSGVATPYRDEAQKALNAYVKLRDEAFVPLKSQLAEVEKSLVLFSNGVTGQVRLGDRSYSLGELKAHRDSLRQQVNKLEQRLTSHKEQATHYLEQGRQKLEQIANTSQKRPGATPKIFVPANQLHTSRYVQPGDAYIGDIFKFQKYYPATAMVISGLDVRRMDVLDVMRTQKITALEALVQLKPDLLRGAAPTSPNSSLRFVTHKTAYDTNTPYDKLAELVSDVSTQLLARGARAVDVASLIAENKQQFTMWNNPNRVTEFNELQPAGYPNPTFLVADPESGGKKSESGYIDAVKRVLGRIADEPDCARMYKAPDLSQKGFGKVIDYIRQQDTNGAWSAGGQTINDPRWLSNRLLADLEQPAYDQPLLRNQVIRIPLQTPHGTGGALYVYEREIPRMSMPRTAGESPSRRANGYKLEVMLDQGTAAWKTPATGMRQYVSQQSYASLDHLLKNSQLTRAEKLHQLAGIWYDLSATSGGWTGGGAGTNHILMAAAYERITGMRLPALEKPADLLAISSSRDEFIRQFTQGQLFQ
jgi:hypothetical protein